MVGPGLGTDDTGAAALWFALETDLPVIVDADALTILAAHPDLVANRSAPTVLTPHAGEFARLAGSPPGDDRVGATRRLADQLGVTVLLKGNVTVIAEPGGPVYLNRAGQSWAATAGSGDVLSGIIGALLAAGLPAGEAAAAAAFVHARAANLSAADPGPHPAPDVGIAHPRARSCCHRLSLTKGLAMSRKRTHAPQIAPAYTGRLAMAPVPSLRLPDEAMDPDAAYRFIHDELMLDGSSRLNLATFVTTWMDPAGREADGRDVRQEHDRQGRIPGHRGDRAAVRLHGRRPVPRRGPARRRPDQRRRRVDHRVERGGDAGRAGAEVALAREGRQGLAARAPRIW